MIDVLNKKLVKPKIFLAKESKWLNMDRTDTTFDLSEMARETTPANDEERGKKSWTGEG